MLIGEFAKRVGISSRMVRYYEKTGLLIPEGRDANGYRTYSESQLETALQIKGLLASGLPTTLVRDLLGVLTESGGIYPEHVDPETLNAVEDEYQRMCRCVECMVARRDALRSYLDEFPR